MLQWFKHDEANLSNKKQKGDAMHTSILPYKPFNWFSNFKYKKILKLLLWGPDLGGSFHCRCEQTQTQQAQYNEFGREADLRTGPL